MPRPGISPTFDATTRRIPIRRDMPLLVGCIFNEEVHLRPPRPAVLDDFMTILEKQRGGVIGIDMNHCIYFMDKAGLMTLSEMFPIIIFIPTEGDSIEYLYSEVSSEVKKDAANYEAVCERIYTMIDRWSVANGGLFS